MMKKTTMIGLVRRLAAFLLLAVMITSVRAQSPEVLADRFDLLPAPREMALTGERHALEGWEIVLAVEGDKLAIAAEEINGRIVELGGEALPVVREASGAPAILIGRWQDSAARNLALELGATLTATDPGEQGYIIETGVDPVSGQPVVLVGGSDAQGTLYGAVTLRRLIQKRDDGNIVLVMASVHDWPDFKLRINGELDLRELMDKTGDALHDTADELKRVIDYNLRHKINGLRVRSVQFAGEANLERRRLADEVAAYAHARGILTRYGGNNSIAEQVGEPQPEGMLERRPGTAYDWGLFEAHRQKALENADLIRGEDLNMYFLHPYDGGGYRNPERWSERSDRTRRMYGDDRALADLENYLVYYEALREHHPNLLFEAVLYPYHFQFGRDDFVDRYLALSEVMPVRGGWFGSITDKAEALRIKEDLTRYHQYLNEHLPPGVPVVMRECSRTDWQVATELFPQRPITIWTYPTRHRGWVGTFSPTVRMAATYWEEGRRDIYFVAGGFGAFTDQRINRLAHQEYLWNVDRPDAEPDFDLIMRRYEHGAGELTDYQHHHLAPRVARILYGKAAPVYTNLMRANVSLSYVMDPERVGGFEFEGEEFEPRTKYLREQADVMARLAEQFDEIVRADLAVAASAGPEEHHLLAWNAYWFRYLGLGSIRARLEAAVAGELTPDQARQVLSRLDELGRQADQIRELSERAYGRVGTLHINEPRFGMHDALDTLQPADYRERIGQALN